MCAGGRKREVAHTIHCGEPSDPPLPRSQMSLQVIITAGHCNRTGGGAPGEAMRTPRFAHAYVDTFTAAGHRVVYIQSIDADGQPDFYSGTLDDVARRVAAVAASLSG